MTENQSPDGWRFAYIKWKSGNRYMSRRTHYFVNGFSLCGEHSDRAVGMFSQTLRNTIKEKHLQCKKCQKKLHEKELQEAFCNPCPQKAECPCPQGTNDWRRCNYHIAFKQAGLWGK